jgi:hypothetical protein
MRAPEALRCRSQAAISDSSCSRFRCAGSGIAAQDADLDLNHIQPAGVLTDMMECQSAQDAHPGNDSSELGLALK